MDSVPEKYNSLFGLIGKNIEYSFSRAYFLKKFDSENLQDYNYVNFDINTIVSFNTILKNNPNIKGLNVTIPYKEAIIPFLNKTNKTAKKIGAVNTISISKKGNIIGYNTDSYGFKKAIKPHLKKHHNSALILGTGGASKAIAYTLKKLNITFSYVSRNQSKKAKFTYKTLTEKTIKKHTLIINCTPLGTFPNIENYPNIPYNAINKSHLLFDLVYNPKETTFLKIGKKQGASTLNGLKMLEYQAEKAWKIWNKK